MIVIFELTFLAISGILSFISYRFTKREDVNPLSTASAFTLCVFSVGAFLLVLIDFLDRL